MGRLLRPSTCRAVIIVVDHRNYAGPVSGLEDPVRIIKLAAEGDADAVIANPGTTQKAASTNAAGLA